MISRKLPNYIRMFRKRSNLSQDDVAFLLGAKAGSTFCRHENSFRIPDLQGILGYEVLFNRPIKDMFPNQYLEAKQCIRKRTRILIERLRLRRSDSITNQKLKFLAGLLSQP